MEEIEKIEIFSIIFLLLLFLIGLIISIKFAIGTTIGGILVILNFHLIKKGIKKIFENKKRKNIYILQHFLRFVLILFIIYILFYINKIDITGFIIGISSIFWGIFIFYLKKIFVKN